MKNSCDILSIVVAAIVGLVALYLILKRVRKWAQGGQFTKDWVRVDGKVVVVTGCNTGIGKETVLELAKRGAKIYMACRNEAKCEEARLEIGKGTGNHNIINLPLDLNSLESVREFARSFLAEESKLDILINNAGVMACPKSVTKDGLETQIGVNHFAHFLLTNLLLGALKAAAPSRIVIVSSSAHSFGTINREDLMSEKSYSRNMAYCQSKLANVLFSRELAKKLQGTGVVSNCLHPGAVRTEMQRHVPWYMAVFYPAYFFFKTPKSGAQTSLALALDPAYEQVTGRYFSDCKPSSEASRAQDDDTATWLWNESEKIVGLTLSGFM